MLSKKDQVQPNPLGCPGSGSFCGLRGLIQVAETLQLQVLDPETVQVRLTHPPGSVYSCCVQFLADDRTSLSASFPHPHDFKFQSVLECSLSVEFSLPFRYWHRVSPMLEKCVQSHHCTLVVARQPLILDKIKKGENSLKPEPW